MSKTKIQIEVDEDQFKELLEKEITDLPKEEIQKILLESIKSYLEGDSTILIDEVVKNKYGNTVYPVEVNKKDYSILNGLLIKREDYYNGISYKASDFLINLLEECDFSGLQELVDSMIEDLKNNYHTILVEVLSKQLLSSIFDERNFRNNVKDIIRVYLQNQNNNKIN